MILRFFLHTDGLYHFADNTQPHPAAPDPRSRGVDLRPPVSKAQITRAMILAAREAGVTIEAITGRLSEKATAKECGIRFVDTRKNRRGSGAMERTRQKSAARQKEQAPAEPDHTPVISESPSGRGGRVKASESTAKAAALAKAQEAWRERARNDIANRTLPGGFTDLDQFLRALAELVISLPFGTQGDLARSVGVDSSTVSKWLKNPPTKRPSSAKLELCISWWKANRGPQRSAAPAPTPPIQTPRESVTRPPIGSKSRSIALTRLSEGVQKRLEYTARLRNLTPIQYAEQILDRHLPRIE